MTETRKIAAILVADVVGYTRLAGADEDRTLARLRALRSDLVDPTIALHHGRIVKRTGDGSMVEFRKPLDVKTIGRELNVRYVLEGSVQRVGARMRVNVQLIEAESGAHLWVERFDKPIADLFEMQDEIVSRIANQLGHELARVEAGWAV